MYRREMLGTLLDVFASLSLRASDIIRFKQGVVNAMLFCAARLGNALAIEQLVSGSGGVNAQVNIVDDFGRSPLYWAVQVRLCSAVQVVLLRLCFCPLLRSSPL